MINSVKLLQASVRENWLIFDYLTVDRMCLQCFDAVGWAAGRASGL